ncbi:bifunctional 4-hydroxy-2-oxoglutarate aldolase/2-dehydro-3-deoxy-phosphogluconate aldolase [Rhodobacter maris]|uniref:2-dehydro-3-deoxy-phosphogluconate aldolase n=1 Tax=Rhodobacter maris TaxID=446682 RepID=A0A285S0T2_9RHOB|nr:bifunctional 4-hydroxy-2-oxoglutarate aldolase/2-dehydro-3-deoxy-phosphogluconate aldolase [Rhodobacter maris]SOC00075.1 2-keto-3-deoxy-phosphogluconate aldolase [Rhodobacter maris]
MTPADQSATAREICAMAPIVPVIVLNDTAHAAPLARALVAGGLPALEVTLRTPCALEAIRAMVDVEGGIVGAGTLITPADVKAAKAAGAKFGVAPGFSEKLVKACEDEGLPLLPGAVTASEIMQALEWGYTMLKFFPAANAGGPAALKALGGPLPQVSFCPTGGVSLQNARDYLSLPNVLCAGGSWVAPAGMMNAGNWTGIESLAAEAASLSRAKA